MAYRTIKSARKDAGLTQNDLAVALGVNRATISKYESGVIDLPPSQAKKIAKILGVKNWYELYPEEKQGDAIVIGTIEGAGLTIKDDDGQIISQRDKRPFNKVVFDTSKIVDAINVTLEREKRKDRYIKAFDMLNDVGQEIAVDRVEELTEIPKYQLHHDPSEE